MVLIKILIGDWSNTNWPHSSFKSVIGYQSQPMAAARIQRAAEMGKALVIASETNQIVNMCRLITQGADVNYVNRFIHEGKERSATPLNQAAFGGHADAARVLISRGAEVNKFEPCNGSTALHASAQGGHVPLIELLMSHGARDKLGQTPLLLAVACGLKVAAFCVLDHGAYINAKDDMGFTPLAMAAQEGHLSVVDLLVLRGADLNLASNQGVTPLSLASSKGHLEVVEFLVEKGAVVDQPRNDGSTALAQASLSGHLEVVDYLLSAGASINHPSDKGFSPLHDAAQEGHLPVVKLLVRWGADINQVSTFGLTPLLQAALIGHKEVVDYLMSKGAKLEAIGTARVTACKSCGAADIPLKKCSGCQTVYYCSPECQKKDWREGDENRHKIQCARLTEMRAQYEEKVNKEIEEKMARFGISPSSGGGGGDSYV